MRMKEAVLRRIKSLPTGLKAEETGHCDRTPTEGAKALNPARYRHQLGGFNTFSKYCSGKH